MVVALGAKEVLRLKKMALAINLHRSKGKIKDVCFSLYRGVQRNGEGYCYCSREMFLTCGTEGMS